MNPLWMPKGSVRGILALATLAVTAAMFFAKIEIPQAWWPLVAAVWTNYFSSSSPSNGTPTPPVP